MLFQTNLLLSILLYKEDNIKPTAVFMQHPTQWQFILVEVFVDAYITHTHHKNTKPS
jgi:hypothetical protein